MSQSDALDALDALDEIVPELEFGRGTHIQWRDYLQQHPDGEKRNPECGDADFHAKMVEVYDKRLGAINKARRALSAIDEREPVEETL